ncbi:hypothetical protein EUGRSUZ_J01382 [Eucalyptus grandis]|uniref:Uncharacterized protein n=2 Tax=Eucalyptus grandis TaxID=71139 RepID=A0ACC3J5X1_EUCGR|nr:hypothetical protein EUGRSUZ_J01382 [Eucalyptus grandis]
MTGRTPSLSLVCRQSGWSHKLQQEFPISLIAHRIRIGKVWWNGLAQSWGWLLVNCLPQLTISGVFGVEVVACLRWCLKYHISWDKTSGLQMHSIPKFGSLPCVHDAGVVVQRPIPWHYNQNAITSSCKISPRILTYTF